MHELLAQVWRSGLVESVHYGSVVALDADGSVAFTLGQPDAITYARSSLKPLQALGLLRNGLALDGELLALCCASHSGEEFHIAGVRRILAVAGLREDDLRCVPDLPLGEKPRLAFLAAGTEPAPVYMNCSGKHAGMLATCVHNGWTITDYLDPAHPLQLEIRAAVEALAVEPVAAVGVDGCGAPLFGFSLTGLARGFRALATAPTGSHERRIADAMGAYPEWVGGTGHEVTALMRMLPGAVAKNGAEGVYAIGLPDGRAVALKIADGTSRARMVVLVAALRRLGVDADGLSELAEVPVLGHGRPVGAVRPAPVLSAIP